MFNVQINTILHKDQRYETAGDWYFDADTQTWILNVSHLANWKEEALVAVHELVELILCKNDGVTEKAVDDFDKEWDKNGRQDKEPGDSPNAPYQKQHCFATSVERMLAAAMNIKWEEYDEHVNALFE